LFKKFVLFERREKAENKPSGLNFGYFLFYL